MMKESRDAKNKLFREQLMMQQQDTNGEVPKQKSEELFAGL